MSQGTPLLFAVFVLLQFGVCSAQYESPYACNGIALNDFLRDTLLTSINTIRARVALGQYERYRLTSSSDMNKLKWDCNLETIAERVVQNCSQSASLSGVTNAINFNYYGPGNLRTLRPNPISTSILKWARIKNAIWPPSNILRRNNRLSAFANMITADATAVGCYYDFCEDRASAACVFSQPAPQHGALVYTSGSPCITGGNCTLPKTGVCEFGLCVNTA